MWRAAGGGRGGADRGAPESRDRGSGRDASAEEPLPATSPLWEMRTVMITPHTAGETQTYEANVLDILIDNLDRLRRGESTLRNEIV